MQSSFLRILKGNIKYQDTTSLACMSSSSPLVCLSGHTKFFLNNSVQFEQADVTNRSIRHRGGAQLIFHTPPPSPLFAPAGNAGVAEVNSDKPCTPFTPRVALRPRRPRAASPAGEGLGAEQILASAVAAAEVIFFQDFFPESGRETASRNRGDGKQSSVLGAVGNAARGDEAVTTGGTSPTTDTKSTVGVYFHSKVRIRACLVRFAALRALEMLRLPGRSPNATFSLLECTPHSIRLAVMPVGSRGFASVFAMDTSELQEAASPQRKKIRSERCPVPGPDAVEDTPTEEAATEGAKCTVEGSLGLSVLSNPLKDDANILPFLCKNLYSASSSGSPIIPITSLYASDLYPSTTICISQKTSYTLEKGDASGEETKHSDPLDQALTPSKLKNEALRLSFAVLAFSAHLSWTHATVTAMRMCVPSSVALVFARDPRGLKGGSPAPVWSSVALLVASNSHLAADLSRMRSEGGEDNAPRLVEQTIHFCFTHCPDAVVLAVLIEGCREELKWSVAAGSDEALSFTQSGTLGSLTSFCSKLGERRVSV